MNLYEDLGIDPAASSDEIARAYRKAAKRAHPDRGGAPEAFERINRAKTVLMDTCRRAEYDKTGKIDETIVDNAEVGILQIAAQAVFAVIEQNVGQGVDPATVDIMLQAQKVVELQIRDHTRMEIESREAVKKLMGIADRISAKIEGRNRIGVMVAAQAQGIERAADEKHEHIERLGKALEILRDHKFKFDAPSSMPQQASSGQSQAASNGMPQSVWPFEW